LKLFEYNISTKLLSSLSRFFGSKNDKISFIYNRKTSRNERNADELISF